MAKLKGTTYNELATILGDSDRERKIGHNTWAGWDTAGDFSGESRNVINVRLHGHLIVRLYSTGAVYISDAGWGTVTTRDRLNQFLPRRWYICQRDHEQFIGDRRNDHELTPFSGDRFFSSVKVSA